MLNEIERSKGDSACVETCSQYLLQCGFDVALIRNSLGDRCQDGKLRREQGRPLDGSGVERDLSFKLKHHTANAFAFDLRIHRGWRWSERPDDGLERCEHLGELRRTEDHVVGAHALSEVAVCRF